MSPDDDRVRRLIETRQVLAYVRQQMEQNQAQLDISRWHVMVYELEQARLETVLQMCNNVAGRIVAGEEGTNE